MRDWQQIIVFISIASMVLGAFAAIGQKNIKRLMAYSSIGHMGFALVGLAAGNAARRVAASCIYMIIYLVMTLGTFAFILAMRRKEGEAVEQIGDLAGLSATNPMMAIVLTVLMFSLAGIPPLAGFFAKCFVFLAAIQAGLWRCPSSACWPRWSAPTTICASSRSCGSTNRRRVLADGWTAQAGAWPVGPFRVCSMCCLAGRSVHAAEAAAKSFF